MWHEIHATILSILLGMIIMSQWFLNHLQNQAWVAELADQAWFDRRSDE